MANIFPITKPNDPEFGGGVAHENADGTISIYVREGKQTLTKEEFDKDYEKVNA